jgi:hypothetical protein
MRFYTTEILSVNRHLTPEGYLLCKGVPIARTGTMLYAAGEVPVTAKDGVITIHRDSADVFSADTIKSFEGKPVTLGHPAVDVSPANWSSLAKGFLQDVRRGTGLEDEFLLADLLITDQQAIQQVRDGLRETSCGYDADYQELQPGLGRQTNIYGNHLALVERGRCGNRCAIGDNEMKKGKWLEKLRAAFTSRDEAQFDAALKEEPETDDGNRAAEAAKTTDALLKLNKSLESLDKRLGKLETRDAEEEEDDDDKDDDAPADETEEEKKERLAKKKAAKEKAAKEKAAKEAEEKEGKTGDSAALLTEAQDVFARAEILSPGVRLPTFDSKAKHGATLDSLCLLKRKALARAFDGAHRDAITPFLGSAPDFKTLTCDAIGGAFVGASEIVRRVNNAQSSNATFDGSKTAAVTAKSVSDINARNKEFWAR